MASEFVGASMGGSMRKPATLIVLVIAALLGALAAKSWLVPLPSVRQVSSQSEFNVHRARARLTDLIGEGIPHPADSPANDIVRDRLVAQLSAMGLEPQVRDAMACNALEKARGVSCARVRNVVVTIGPSAGRHLLLNAHYDSSIAGPGAGDDGAGVATLLEVASIMKDEPLRRPVTFLFNEGEELGLVGARAFLQRDPLAAQVDSLINLEARGTTGPVNMFETSRPNGAAIRAFSRAVKRPVASSLATDVYRQLPNYTDVNSFAERGWTTLNLAMTGNETRYHSPGDDLHALDERSLQHMGDQTLGLARELAKGVPQAGAQRIFMDMLGVELITLPQSVGLLLLAGLVGLFAWIAWRRRSFGRPLLTMLAGLVAGTAVAWLGELIVGFARPGMFWRAYPLFIHLAVYASMVAAGLAVLRTIAGGIETERLRTAYWLLFLLIGAAVALIAPGGIIYFLLPPLVLLPAMLARKSARGTERWAALIAVALLFLTYGVTLAEVEELHNQGPMWLFAPLGALIILPVLIEAQPIITEIDRRSAFGLGALLALAGWVLAAAMPAYSADRQQRFSIEHVTDATTGKASWSVINDHAALPSAYRRIGEWRWAKLPYSERKRWLSAAPAVAGLKPPTATAVAIANGRPRIVKLLLRTNGADSVTLVAPEDADIRSAGVEGFVRPIDRSVKEDKYYLQCFGRSCDGQSMTIVVGKPGAVELTIVGTRFGLPPGAARLVAARPKFARPQYSPDSTITIGRVRI
jgi:hypothetical protein